MFEESRVLNRAVKSEATPWLLTDKLNEHLFRQKTGPALAVHKFRTTLPTMEDINGWIERGAARTATKKQENVDDWVQWDNAQEVTKVTKKLKKKSRKLVTTAPTSNISSLLTLHPRQKGKSNYLNPRRSDFDPEWPSRNPDNPGIDLSKHIVVQDGYMGKDGKMVIPESDRITPEELFGPIDLLLDENSKMVVPKSKTVVPKSSKVTQEELWHQIGRQVEASCSRFDTFGPSSRPKQNTFETKGYLLARSKTATVKDKKRIQELLKIKPYSEFDDNQPIRLSRTPNYWERRSRQTLQSAVKKKAKVCICKKESYPKCQTEARDHLQHVFVVNGSAMAFKDRATLGFVHWFAEENVIAQRIKRSKDDFHHEFDLSGFNNDEIKMRLYDGKTFIIQATRPCRGRFLPKTVIHKVILPVHIPMDSIVISRNDNGHLFIRQSPPPKIKSVSEFGTPY